MKTVLLLLSILLLFSCNNAKKPLHCTEYINCEPVKSQLTFGLKGKVKAVVEVESWSPYGTDTYDSTIVIEFNEQGFVTKHQDTTYSFELDKKGKIIQVNLKAYFDTLMYDGTDKLTKYYRLGRGSRTPEIITKYEYEKNKRIKSSVSQIEKDSYEYIENYSYNSDGSYTIIRPKPGGTYNDTLSYNKDGLLSKSTEYVISVISPNGIVNDIDGPNPDSLIMHYEYSNFDEKGNWTKCSRRAISKGRPNSWASRKYTRRIIYN